jgi:hypothetical protein
VTSMKTLEWPSLGTRWASCFDGRLTGRWGGVRSYNRRVLSYSDIKPEDREGKILTFEGECSMLISVQGVYRNGRIEWSSLEIYATKRASS